MSGGNSRLICSSCGNACRRRRRVRPVPTACTRAARSAAAILLASTGLGATTARAQDSTWNPFAAHAIYTDPSNWTNNTVPYGTATFSASRQTSVNILEHVPVQSFVFTTGGPAYSFYTYDSGILELTGAGIVNNTSNQVTFNFVNNPGPEPEGRIVFTNSSSSGGSGTGVSRFNLGAGNSLTYAGNSSAGERTIVNLQSQSSVLDISSLTNSGLEIGQIAADSRGSIVLGSKPLTVGSSTLSDNTIFNGVISGEGGSLAKTEGGFLTLTAANTYTGGTSIEGSGGIELADGGTLGAGAVTVAVNSVLLVNQSGNTTLANQISGAGSLQKFGTGTLTLTAENNVSGMVVVWGGGTLQIGNGGTSGAIGPVEYFYLDGVDNRLAFNKSTDIIVGSPIVGTGSIVQRGTGTTFLTADNTLDGVDHSGLVVIEAGTLSIGKGGTTGTLGTGNVINDATLRFDRSNALTAANAISGSGNVVQAGTGTTTLTAANTYTGGTTVDAGTLRLGAGGSLAATGALTVNGGTFDLSNNSQTVGTLSGTGGTIALGSGTLTTSSAVDSSLASAVTGTGNLVKGGPGTLTLTGDNTYSGTTTIQAGTLQVGNGGTTGTLGSGAVTNEGALVFNRQNGLTVGNAISGSGQVVQSGAGGSLGSTGALTVTGGTFDLNNNNQTVGTLSGTGGAIALGSGTLRTDSAVDSSLASTIAGTGGLEKLGTSTLTLTANNTYSGETAIYGGSLQIGNGGTTGSLGTGAVVNNGGLIVNRSDDVTLANTISGFGSLTKSAGSTTLTLTGNNTYSGTTTINGGTLQIGNGGATGSIGNGAVVNNGALVFNRSGGQIIANAISGTGSVTLLGTSTNFLTGNNTYTGTTTISGGTLRVGDGGTSGSLGTGAVINNADLIFNRRDDVTVGNNISGSGNITKSSTNKLTLTGTSTYTGATFIDSGTLQIGDGGATGTIGSGLINNAGALIFNRSGVLAIESWIVGAGSISQIGAGTTILKGANTSTGTTTISSGTLQIGDGGTTGEIGTGAVVNNAALVFNRSDGLWVSGAITGTGSVSQIGTGTTLLTGNNTYSGTTTISAGALEVGSGGTTGTLGTGNVLNDGTLQIQRGDDITVANTISGSGSFVKAGQGTLTITGDNSYSGITNVAVGWLDVGGGGTSGTLGTGEIVNNAGLRFNRSDDVTIVNDMSGLGIMEKVGNNTTILTGTNSGSGRVTIAGGTLQIGNGGTTGTLGTGNITNNATLAFNRSDTLTVSALISGSGGVAQWGGGTTVLSRANTYSGGTTISAGTLSVSADNNLGAAGGGITFSNSSTLQTTSTFTTGRAIGITRVGTLETAAGTTLTVDGVVSGAGALAKSGDGTAVLTAANTYAGGTRINAGTLSISAADQLGAAGTGITYNGSGTLRTTSTLALDRTVDITGTGALEAAANTTLTVNGAVSGTGTLVKSGDGTVVLTATNAIRTGMQINAGTLSISASNQTGDSRGEISFGGGTLRATGDNVVANQTINLASANGNFDVTGVRLELNGQVSGANSVVKTGDGVLGLHADNSYSGTTTITAGEVRVGDDGTTGTFGAGNVVNNGRIRIRRSNSYTLGNTISGTGEVIQNGNGTTILTADNTYAGGTTIVFGTLQVGDGNTTGTMGTGGVSVGASGTLVFNRSDTLVISGEVRGNGALKQVGSGTTVLTGNNINLGGSTTISAGTLQIGDGGTSGRLGSGAVTNDGTLTFNRSNALDVSAAIGGSGGLQQIGSGTTSLTGANTYTGTTTISAGTLSVGNGGGGGTLGTGDVAVGAGGKLQFNRFNELIVANQISGEGGLVQAGGGTTILTGNNTYTGGTTVSAGTLAGTTSSLQGNILNNGTVRFDQGTNGTYAGAMSGTGRFTKSGAGTLILSGANSYSGGTTVSAGTLQGNTTSLQGNIVNNAAVVFDQGANGTYAGAMSGNGGLTKDGGGTLTLTGANSHTGGTTVNAGTLQLGAGGSLASTGALAINGGNFDLNGRNQTVGALSGSGGAILLGSGTLTAGNAASTTLAAAISGSGALVKQGTGTLTLAADNSYSGGTTISGGILQVGNGGTTGSITGNVVNNATLAFNRSDDITFGGTISGSGALDKLGSEKLILTADNTYSGLTTIAAGTLQLGNGGTTGSIAGNVLNNGVLAFNRSDDIVFGGNVDGSGAISYMGPGKVTLTGTISNTGGTVLAATVLAGSDAALGAAGATLTFAGGTLQATDSFTVGRPVSLITGGGTFDTAGKTLTVTGNVTGAGGLTKAGDGTLILGGTNSYSGGTTVSGGTLQGTTASLQGNILNNATVAFSQATDGIYANVLSGSGNVSIGGGGAVTFTGANSYTGTTTIASGSKLNLNGGTLGTGAVGNSGELHFTQGVTVSGDISGSGAVFLEEDSGTTIFTGNNSYTGSTRVWSGSTLSVGNGGTSGTLGTGRVQINAGTLRFDRSDALVVAGEISGNGNVVQAGGGTTALTFDSSYGGTTTIEAGTLKLGNGGTTGSLGSGGIVNNATLAFDRSNNLFVANAISGSGGIVQSGTGATYLTGNNTYSGTTTITAGTLSVGNAGSSGTLGTGDVINNSTLRLFRGDSIEIANQISGSGNLEKAGAGIATLTGANSYSGTTSILSGILRVGNGGTLGSGEVVTESRLEFSRSDALTVANVISGSGLVAQTGAGTTTFTGNNSYGTTLIAAGTLSVGDGGTTGSLGTGEVFNDAALLFNRSNALTVVGDISGIGSVTQMGSGITSLTGTGTYTGGTTISGGTLQLGNGGTTGTIAGDVLNDGTLAFNRADTMTFAGVISGGGAVVQVGLGTTILTGANTYTGGTTVSAGTLQGTTTSLQGNILNNATVAFNQSTAGTYAGNMSGTGGLLINGTGTVLLSGLNTYSGGTTVLGGTLQGTTTSLQGNITNNAQVTFNQATNGTYAGNMSGTGSLTLAGGGQYTLTGTNSYTGGTSLQAGALIGNANSLQGNILNNGAVTFSQTGTGTYAGNMSGSGTMTLQGGGILTMTGNNTYTGATTVDASTLIVNGSLASTVAVTNGGILAGNGSTGGFISNGGIIAPGNSIGTLNINGNFTQNGGTYVVEVNPQGQNDRVNVNGTATINGASVQVLAAPGNYATSTTYTILNATGGISGTYTGVVTDYAFLTPTLAYSANNVFLTLALQGSTPFSGFGGNTLNQRNVGAALDQTWASASGDFATVIGALANLSTGQAGPTLNTISGQPYADFGTFNVANNALFMNTLGQQMALARGAAGSGLRQALAQACDIEACDGASPFSVWASAVGGLGSVQGDGNTSTFTYNIGGTAAGIDYRVSPSLLVGLGAGFTSGTQWVDSFQGKGWANTLSVAAYGSFTHGSFYLDALAGYAYSNNQLQRQIAIPGLQQRTANGSTGVNQFLGQVETGYKLGLHAPMQASVTPFARFQASSINQAAFSEWGANSLGLNVAQQTTTSLRSVLGADFAAAIGLGNTRTVDLGLRLGWQHEYANTARPMTAAFAGAPTANFTVYGATPQRDSAAIGFQAATDIAAGAQLYMRYDGEVGATANNHALNLGLRLRW